MMRRSNASLSSFPRLTAIVESMLGLGFVGLAAWFTLASPPASIPLIESVPVQKSDIVPGARRAAIGDPPVTAIGGYSHTCNDCHRLFNSPPVVTRELVQHASIQLKHGMNDRCFNCHDDRDRERLVLMDGSTVSFSESARLCAQCHGPVYRDWQYGTHGKTLGSWDAKSGRQRRLRCTECHDAHAPAYESIRPLPGPNTLRMGEQGKAPEHESRHMPLSIKPAVVEHPPVQGKKLPPEEKPR